MIQRKLRTLTLAALLAVPALGACADDPSAAGTVLPPEAGCVGPSAPAPADAPAPGAFALVDFQPERCSFGDTYGLERFRGRPTLVALLAGW